MSMTEETEFGGWNVLDFFADIADIHPQLPFIVVQRTIRKKSFDEIARMINAARRLEVAKGQVRADELGRGAVISKQTVFNLWKSAVERSEILQRWANAP